MARARDWTAITLGSVLALALSLPGKALGAPDALDDYRAAMKRLGQEEKRYWDGFRRQHDDAINLWRAPWLRRREDTAANGVIPQQYVDLTGLRALFDGFRRIQEQRGEAAVALAKSRHEDALARLVAALFALADDIDEADAALPKAKPSGGWGQRNQLPSVRRDGLAAYQVRLEAALAAVPGIAQHVTGKAYARAVSGDRKRSLVRRVALLDVLGAEGGEDARAFLESVLGDDLAFLRIAALEGLVDDGALPSAALTRLLDDPCPVVRRALVGAIGSRAPGVSAWIGPLTAAAAARTGQERAECISALETLTGEALGDDPSAWSAWYAANAEDIDAGAWKRAADNPSKTRAPRTGGVAFYGARSPSRGVIFILDGSTFQLVPADYQVQRTKWYGDWAFGPQGWKDETHRAVQLRELGRALASLPADGVFGAVISKESAGVDTLGAKALLTVTKRNRKKAHDFLESHAPRAFRSELSNLVTAMELAGLEPGGLPRCAKVTADTGLLVCDGSLRGGHFMVPEAALAAFRRLNRFRRMVVHTIRICDAGPESERLLRGIAEASGGSYHWARRP